MISPWTLSCHNRNGSTDLETSDRFYQRTVTRPATIVVSLPLRVVALPKGTVPEKKLQELKAKREPLFRRLASNPNQIHLALKIKIIDDQIAECMRIVQDERRVRTKLTR